MATSNYPGSLDDYSTLPSSGTPITVSNHYFGPAITNIEAELGTDPAGSFTDVKSRLDSGLVTMVDMWRLTADKTSDGDITSSLERVDDASFGQLGTGMTQSSGIFEFPETGIYRVDFIASGVRTVSGSDNIEFQIYSTIDGSNYTEISYGVLGAYGGQLYDQGIISAIIDVTNTSNVKVKFRTASHADTNTVINGDSSKSETAFLFIRLGGT